MSSTATDAATGRRAVPGAVLVRHLPRLIGAVVFTWLFVWPLVMLVYGAFRTSPIGASPSWTMEGVTRVFTAPETWSALATSLVYALVITFFAMAIAIFFATVSTRFDVPLRRWITPAMMVIVAMPTVLYALAWAMLGAGESGLIHKSLSAMGLGSLAPLLETRSWFGLIVVTALKAGALAYLVVVGAFRNRNAALEEAARISGASGGRAFFGIELPALMPAILAAALYVFVKGLEAFETPAMLGVPAGIEVYSTHIYDYLRGGLRPDYAAASVASLVIVLILAALVTLQWRLTGGGRSYSSVGGRAKAGGLRPAGRARTPLTVAIVLFLLVGLAIPTVQIVLSAFQPYLGVSTLTTANIEALLANDAVVKALQSTLAVSAIGGALAVLLGFVIAYAFVRMRSAAGRFVQIASWVPAAMPGLVLGLALLWSVLTTPGGSSLYGTIWVLVIGLAVATAPLATRTLEGPLSQIGVELEEAARVFGGSPLRAIGMVTARILSPSLLSAWFLVGITMSGILDVPILLGSTDTQLIATVSFSYYNNGEPVMASALYVVFTACLAALALALTALGALIRLALPRARSGGAATPATHSNSEKEHVR
ncbi:iron ABC transporter permease [Streptomyces sp. NPDC052052]|uniref:ABC transporter permease n=1 Tax=Streptomyces sp. NPDC052052 TaxID=3154756 RepID=UPI003438F14A